MKINRKHSLLSVRNAIFSVALLLSLVACSKNQPPSQALESPTPETTSETLPSPTATVEIQTTPVATHTAVTSTSTSTQEAGMIVFSMADGLYTHLFAYNPAWLTPSRLTAYDWNDRDPAISPDGTQLAFASDRDGQWDIYILDFKTDGLTRITNTQTYDGEPAWSPDGQYLIYETLNGEHLDLIIQSVSDPESAPIQLTSDAGNNFSPDWSPNGQLIAFVTDRAGRDQIWTANLQKPDERYQVIAASDEADFTHPDWSPDGTKLAWESKDPEQEIQMAVVSDLGTVTTVSPGSLPAWSPDGKTLLAVFKQPENNFLIDTDILTASHFLPVSMFSQEINSLDWQGGRASEIIGNYASLQTFSEPAPLFTPKEDLPASSTGRSGVVALDGVKTDNPYLADSANESFNALRSAVGKKLGWDYLNALDNAYLPISAPASPGIAENWLFTGRAIAVNSVPLDADWMVVTREAYAGQTYWRVWLKCLNQTGGCGEPIRTSVWDFSARYSGDTVAYENGGKLTQAPAGYWFDFTEFAHRFGWERLPAQSNWRYYLNGSFFNLFVFKQDLTWQEAMLELYPLEALEAAGYAAH